MAKTETGAPKDAYLEYLTAQARENDDEINKSVPKRLWDKKAELETSLRNYKAHLKLKEKS